MNRRDFLQRSAALTTCAFAPSPQSALAAEAARELPIIDTHQHLWDLGKFRLKWLSGAPPVLNRSYTTNNYVQATEGLGFQKAVYMEVDVDPAQQVEEAEHILELCKRAGQPTVAAVISGRPADPGFAAYLKRFRQSPLIKGVRQVLHAGDTPRGYCLDDRFVQGIQLLGEAGMSFDLCMRAAELKDAVKLVDQCKETRFVVDHCGNADPKIFKKTPSTDSQPSHNPDQWKRDMTELAKRANTTCKISGIVANAPKGWKAVDLAPIVNFCLDTFGPDRVVFGSDWPVCLLGSSLRGWVTALREIVSERPEEQRRKLWSENAARFYALA